VSSRDAHAAQPFDRADLRDALGGVAVSREPDALNELAEQS
jgi:hypothetical protein